MRQRRRRRADDLQQGATRLGAGNADVGSEPGELPRVQGDAGGGLSSDPIKCRRCHNRGHTAPWEHRGDLEGRLPGEAMFGSSHVRGTRFPEAHLVQAVFENGQLPDHLSHAHPGP